MCVSSNDPQVPRLNIPQYFATAVCAFCAEHLNPYLNFHPPGLAAEEITDNKGKIRKRYPQRLVMTPFEKLAPLDNVPQHLRTGVTLETHAARPPACPTTTRARG